MTSVFILNPNNIKEEVMVYNYTFLNEIYPMYSHFYNLLKNTDDYKIKNIYNFIYIRLIKINKNFPEIKKIKKKNIKSLDEFDKEIKDYISKDKLKAIIIINSISHYFTPYKFN